MVFSGRPSTACLSCRQRRLKCDRVPTGCSQCRRKGIQCSGYRDPSALRLRDESSRLACKFSQTSKSTETGSHVQVLSKKPPPDQDPWVGYLVQRPRPPFDQPVNDFTVKPSYQQLGLDLQDASMAYFLTSFIYATPYQGYVPAFCLDGLAHDDACSMAISATALAAYSRHIRSAENLESARQQYSTALTRVNKLLSNHETAILDRTLASVLVLALFEAIVFQGGTSPTSWTAHILGSIQLLRLRGTQQLKSPASRKMFAHASNNIRTSCIQRAVPVPDDFIALDKQLAVISEPDEISALSPIMAQVASLKARAITTWDCNLVHEALRLDKEIVALTKLFPDWMRYRIRPNEESAVWVYRRVCHVYPSARIAKLWNAVRLLRFSIIIFIKDVAIGALDPDLSGLHLPDESISRAAYVINLGQYAKESLKSLAMDFLASIPSFVQDEGFGRRFIPSARSLAWPLGIIENTSDCGMPAMEYARKYLGILAGELNIPEAVHPSRDPGSADDWMHLFHLG